MLHIDFGSAVALGGAPFRLNKCTALSSSLSSGAAGAGTGASIGGPWGAAIGGALGVASSLLGGLFGSSNTRKTNEMNYRIMKEQNAFNSEEAKKNRDWQEMMYRMFGTSSAKANDMRAAGLNALLGDVSSSGNVGSGATASAAESAQMLPMDYSFVGDAATRGVNAFNSIRDVDSSVSLKQSQEVVNQSVAGLNQAQSAYMSTNNDMLKLSYKFAMDTYNNRLLQEQFKAELSNWQGFDAMYDARLKAFELYNISPQLVEQNVARTMSFYASAFRDIADGKYSLAQVQNYGKWLSIQQTFSQAATLQGRAAMLQGRAAMTNAETYKKFYGSLGGYYNSLTAGNNMSNEMTRYYTDFMLGKMPLGKAESILRQTPYKHLLELNVSQNEWSLQKLMQEPDLIRSLSGMYKANTGLTNKQIDSYDTDKVFERMESVTRSVKNTADAVGTFIPAKSVTKGLQKSVSPTHADVPPSGKSWMDALRENPSYRPK